MIFFQFKQLKHVNYLGCGIHYLKQGYRGYSEVLLEFMLYLASGIISHNIEYALKEVTLPSV